LDSALIACDLGLSLKADPLLVDLREQIMFCMQQPIPKIIKRNLALHLSKRQKKLIGSHGVEEMTMMNQMVLSMNKKLVYDTKVPVFHRVFLSLILGTIEKNHDGWGI
jgi:hypothetical protein